MPPKTWVCALPWGHVFLSKIILPDGQPKRYFEVGRGSFRSTVLQRAELSGQGDRIGNSCRTGRSSGSLLLSNRKFHTADHNRVSTAILDRLALMTAIVNRDLIPAFCNFSNLKDVVKRGVFGYVKSMVELEK